MNPDPNDIYSRDPDRYRLWGGPAFPDRDDEQDVYDEDDEHGVIQMWRGYGEELG